MSPDSRQGEASNPQSLNLYIYALERPTSLIDPSGLDSCGFSLSGVLGCAENIYNGTVDIVVKPTVNFVEKKVVPVVKTLTALINRCFCLF